MPGKTIEGYRLSPQQERLWLSRGATDSQAYRVGCVVTIGGGVDAMRIRQALGLIVQRHEILRTEFAQLDGMALPLQVINEAGQVEVESHDLSLYEVVDRQTMIESVFVAEMRQDCSYDRGLTLRAKLFKISASEQTMIISLPAMYSDLAGLRNLVGELSRLLNEICPGPSSGELLQYADYSQILHELIESEETESGKDYWRRQSISSFSKTRLPIEKDSGEKKGFLPEILAASFGAELTAKAEALAQQRETSVSAFLLACWQLLVWRLTAQSEIVTGLTCDGRTYEGLADAVGLFAKKAPFVGVVREDLPFDDLLKRTAESMRDVFRHQEYFTWKQMTEEGAAAASQKIFPICFEFEEQTGGLAAGAFTLRIDRQAAITDRYLLNLKCEKRGEELCAEFIYDSGVFERGAIERLARQYLSLVRSACARPGAALRDLSPLSPEEREQLLEGWNQTGAEWGAFRPLHRWFEEQVGRCAERTAIEFGSQWLSYQELNERANRLARRLRRLGVGPDAVVGLWMERSLEMVVGALGALKAGSAYLPLDASYPELRLSYVVKDAGANVLLTQARLSDKAAESGQSWLSDCSSESDAQVIRVDRDWEDMDAESGEDLGISVEEENLAYVIYTSGSTGRPKGVMITHGGLRNYLSWSLDAYGMKDGDGSLLHSPLCFDLTVTSLYPPLLVGGRLKLTPEDQGVEGLSEALQEEKDLGLVKLTPAHLEAISQWMPAEEMKGRAKAMVIGGEALFGERLKKWREYAPGTRLINEYGPTETVVGCCAYEIGEGAKISGAVPIGRPIANTKAYILDDKQEPVGIGESGELYIGGAGLARGYVGRADETADMFAPNPYGANRGERLYRTRDAARRRWDGEIEYQGRNDQQVKLRGYRIELGEIEAMLSSHPEVRETVVIAREEEEGGRRLVAYYTGEKVSVEDLRAHLATALPEYMIPAAYAHLERLPLTANGKLDRRALPAPDVRAPEGKDGYLPPRTPAEEIMIGIFEEVLKLDLVGRKDNFFELGGHSLLALQVVSRVRKMFGVGIGVRIVFEKPTVEGLASRIEEAMAVGEKAPAPPLVRIDRENVEGGRLPLSFAQQRLWFIDQLEPGNAAYNIPGAMMLEGKLNLNALESAINEIVRRHEVLRTRIEAEGGEPAQVIDEWEPRRLDVEDLTGIPPEEIEEEVSRRIREEARTGFDLKRGPLLRMKVLKLKEEEHLALYTMHHIVSDAWSMTVLMREARALYDAINEGKRSPLPELKIQYADYAYWQRNYLKDEALETHMQYWKSRLDGKLPVMELPSDRPRPQGFSYRGAAIYFLLPSELSESLRGMSRRAGVTLSMVLLAAFKTLLCKYTAQEDVIVGVPWLNRDRIEIEPLIGFFVNMLPLRTDLSGNPRFSELLMRVKDVALGAFAHQEAPFEKLVEEIRPERKSKQTPLYNVVFTLQNERELVKEEKKTHLNELKISPVGIERQSAKVDIWLGITETQGALEAGWIYSADLFEEETLVRMHGHFETLLFSIVARPDAPIDELEILTEAERAKRAINQAARREFNYSRFKSVKPRAIPLSEG
jgi:amino acid adenylation domain-containing protein